MEPKIKAIKQHISNNFDGKQASFARTIGVSRQHLNMVLKNNGRAGAKFIGALISYCENQNINYKRFIKIEKNKSNQHSA